MAHGIIRLALASTLLATLSSQSVAADFGDYDINQDNWLSEIEVDAAFDIPPGLFQMLDVNKDQRLTRDEILSVISPDPVVAQTEPGPRWKTGAPAK